MHHINSATVITIITVGEGGVLYHYFTVELSIIPTPHKSKYCCNNAETKHFRQILLFKIFYFDSMKFCKNFQEISQNTLELNLISVEF